jgi:hypothetical protein
MWNRVLQEKKLMNDIKKSAKNGQMVSLPISRSVPHYLISIHMVVSVCCKDSSKGSHPNTAIHPEIHADEGSAPGCELEDAVIEE